MRPCDLASRALIMSRSWEHIGRRNARPDIAILPANLGGAVRQIDGDPVQIWRAAFGCEIEGQLVHVRPCASAGDVPPHSPIVCPHHGEGMNRNLIDESHAGKAGRPNVVVGIDEGPMVERSAGQLGEERKHGRPHRDPADLRGVPKLGKIRSQRARALRAMHVRGEASESRHVPRNPGLCVRGIPAGPYPKGGVAKGVTNRYS